MRSERATEPACEAVVESQHEEREEVKVDREEMEERKPFVAGQAVHRAQGCRAGITMCVLPAMSAWVVSAFIRWVVLLLGYDCRSTSGRVARNKH
jgi:hypothetical protein